MLKWVLGMLLVGDLGFGGVADWSREVPVPSSGRANIYEMSSEVWPEVVARGKLHALVHPVGVSGAIVPLRPMQFLLEGWSINPIHLGAKQLLRALYGFRDMDGLQKWAGLQTYPEPNATGVYSVPYPGGVRPSFRMGFSPIKWKDSQGFSISCAACHVGNLFGRRVLGMTTRFPTANRVFGMGKSAFAKLDPLSFQVASHATNEERRMFERTRENLQYAQAKDPAVPGLDTSLAQVALSLARRAPDAYASRFPYYAAHPRPSEIEHLTTDSKPAVWWNLKYKNRWLSDGSIVSGNPIFTNYLWNELGRGTSLEKLNQWLKDNESIVEELTAAVFATEPPQFTDFFELSDEFIHSAKRGEKLFNATCKRCHGGYEKNWDASTKTEQAKTIRVVYHAQTPVLDVGTDPQRYLGMRYLLPLNDLQISQDHGIVIEAQRGYVPPPLVGIWARWPYLHNNSIPSLKALLTPSQHRPARFWMGEANNPHSDFDRRANGYPTGMRVPKQWTYRPSQRFDTTQPGLSHRGHDEGIFAQDGVSIFSDAQRDDLIAYLQTL